VEHQSETLVKRRKWKNRLSIAAVIAVTAAIAMISIGNYINTRTTDTGQAEDEFAPPEGFGSDKGAVMATGTTSVGVNAVTFDIDFLEDANLYVEEVYLSNGDSVQAGDKYLKFTDASIADARTELEEAALSAELAYRSGILSDGESKLQAKYEYDTAMLEAQYAQQVYEDTLAQIEADYAQAKKEYDAAQQEYDDYLEKVQNNSFYEEYDIENLKKAYEEAYDLYIDRKEYYEVTDDELKNNSNNNNNNGNNSGGGSNSAESMEPAALMTLSGSAGGTGDGKESESQKTETEEPTKTEDTAQTEPTTDTDTTDNPETDTDTDATDNPETEQKPSAPNGGERPKGFGDAARQEEQNAKKDREWIVKTVSLLEQETQDAKTAYTTALEEYEDEISSAELNLQKLLNQLETAREDYTDADVSYQKQTLSAKTAYELSVAKGQTAQNDYQTQLTGLADSLEKLQDEKEEAAGNLALFEELVGDGYLYTQEGGTVLMLMAQEGRSLAGGSMIFAYSNPKQLSVSVSVSQNDIAKLSVGEKATVLLEEHGSYSGIIETINPVSVSNSRTSVTYTVTVNLQGDVSGLEANLTANVIFGEAVNMGGEPFNNKEGEHGRSGKADQKAHDREN